MNKNLLFIVLFLISQISFAQLIPEIEWLRTYDGIGKGNDFVNDIEIDNNFNIYLAGRSAGTNGISNFLIQKYSNTGDSLLNIRFSTSPNAYDEAQSIAVDSQKNIYAVGRSTFGQSSFYNVFSKFSANGNIIWSKNYFYNIESISEGVAVVLDHQENPIFGVLKFPTYSNSSVNILKYNSDGDSLWTKTIADDTSSYSFELFNADKLGNIYAGIEQSYFIPYGDLPEIKYFLIKLNQSGNIVWNKTLYSTPRKLIFDNDSNTILLTGSTVLKFSQNGDSLWNYDPMGLFTDIAIDSNNNILISGYTSGIGIFDYLVKKISSDGNEIWSKTFNSDEDLRDFASNICVDNENNVYVTGSSNDMFTEGVSYTLKYNPSGEMVWKHRFDAMHGIFEDPYSIFVDDSNSVIIGGSYYDSTNGSNFFAMKIKQKTGTGIKNSKDNLPEQYSLSQNYPNPFNPSTVIQYSLPVRQAGIPCKGVNVQLKIYDVLGNEVATLVNETQKAGKYEVNFKAAELASGIYIYTINANNFHSSKKMLLLK